MSELRRRAVLTAVLAALSVAAAAGLGGCGTGTTHDVDEGVLTELSEELGERMCQRQLDSLAFEIDGIFFRSDIDFNDREAVMALIPYPLPTCPVTGEPYEVVDQGTVIIISCPAGHGSVEVR